MGTIINSFKMLAGKQEERDHSEDLGIAGKMMDLRVWAG
jgi:hypothetical protein